MASRKPADRSVSIVGAGRLGTALGIALHKVGYQVRLVVTKNSSTARHAARLIGSGVKGISEKEFARANSKYAEIVRQSPLILIATPDDVIPQAAQRTARVFEYLPRRSRKTRVVLHTSGALSSNELRPLKAFGLATGSLHPLISISDPQSGSTMFHDSFFCIEGDQSAIRVATSLARALGARTFTVSAAVKPLYHAAAVMVSGDVVALLDIAATMLQKCGLSARRSRQVLLRLLNTAIVNLDTMNTVDVLTGPFARGDVKTVTKHLGAMKSKDLVLAREVYAALGRHSLNMLADGGKQTAAHIQIAKLVSHPEGD